MRFLIDARLPPALAGRLEAIGHQTEHVHAVGLGAASDRKIWAYAVDRKAVVITNDQDFADLSRRDPAGSAVVWIRLGNTTVKALWAALEPALPEILEGLARGERLIEVI